MIIAVIIKIKFDVNNQETFFARFILTTNAIIAGLQLRNENGMRTIFDS